MLGSSTVAVRLVIAILFGVMFWTPRAVALQATAYDLQDFIGGLGGWFYPADQAIDPADHYWVQMSYTVKPPATNSNITTITMTKVKQKINKNAGVSSTGTVPAPCSTDPPVTETVTLDLRDLQAVSTISPASSVGPLQVWSVNLLVIGGKALIRVNRVMSPPQCAQSGTTYDVTTQQSDVNSYPIQFSNQEQAKYFQMLISSAVPTFSPPTLNGTATGQ